jgi:hypothetical protein
LLKVIRYGRALTLNGTCSAFFNWEWKVAKTLKKIGANSRFALATHLPTNTQLSELVQMVLVNLYLLDS